MASSKGKPINQMLLESFQTKGDVTFSVGEPGQEEEIKASVYILGVASPVFDTMFNSTWNEQKKVIKIPDIRPDSFRHFLKLLMTGDLKASHIRGLKLNLQDVFDILYAAKKYDVALMHSVCIKFLKAQMSVDNAVVIYKCAGSLNEVDLENSSFAFIAKWAEAQCAEKKLAMTGKNLRMVLGDLLFFIRFPLMSPLDMAKVVRPTQILSDKELLDLHDHLALPSTERKATIPFGGSSRSWKPPMTETEIIEQPAKRARVLPPPIPRRRYRSSIMERLESIRRRAALSSDDE